MNINTQITNKEKLYVIFLGLLWSYNILLSYFRAVILRIPIISALSTPICICFIIVFLCLSFNGIIERLKWTDIWFYLAALFFFFLNFAIFSKNASYIKEGAAEFFLVVLPMYFVGASFRQEISEYVFRILYYLSFATITAFSIYTVFIKDMAEDVERQGDMFAAYTLLPHLCMVFYYGILKRKVISLALAGIGTVVLFFLGSRGPVLCLLIFVALSFFQVLTRKKKFVFIGLAGIGCLALSKTSLINSIMLRLYRFACDFHLSTRVFEKYFSDSITYDSGRSIIKETLWKLIRKNSGFGAGLFGDRVATEGHYAHDLVLEIITQFGVAIGVLILAVIAFLTIKAVIRVRGNKEMQGILNIAFCLGICKLFLSGTYLEEPFFFLFLGLCVGIIREKCPTSTEVTETPPPEETTEQPLLINA